MMIERDLPPSRLREAARRMRDRLAEPGAGGRRPCDAVVAYGGGEPQSRADARLVPWTRLHEEPWADG